MKLSVVVPVFNEEKNIASLLNRIKNNITSQDEIIVVDDGSTDNTLSEIQNLDCKLIVHKKNKGKGQSLIDGINEADGEIILFFKNAFEVININFNSSPSTLSILYKSLEQ